MGKHLVLFILILIAIFRGQDLIDLLDRHLPGLMDVDAAGLQYLLDTFPYSEIDYAHLKQDDLDNLFFLSPLSKFKLWENRNNIKDYSDIEALSFSEDELALIRLSWREYDIPLHLIYYGHAALQEELPMAMGSNMEEIQRAALWQKIKIEYGPFRAGIATQKDAGEISIIDSYNTFLQYQNDFITAGVGNHFIDFGTGLVSGRPKFSNYQIPGIHFANRPIVPYAGSDEFNPLWGGFLSFRYKTFSVNASYALNQFDGEQKETFYQLSSTGYHRTENEILKRNIIDAQFIHVDLQWHLKQIAFGASVNRTQFPGIVKTQNVFFKTSTDIYSVWLNYKKMNEFSAEVVLYPHFSGNINASFREADKKLDAIVYFYGDNPSFTGNHAVFNSLPYDAMGINIRWQGSEIRSGVAPGGYIFYENRDKRKENLFYGGFYLNFDYLFFSRLSLAYKNYKHRNIIDDKRWDIQYKLFLSIKGRQKFVLAAGLVSDGKTDKFDGLYASLRYRYMPVRFLKLIANIVAWNTPRGTQFWVYGDGLPESFTMITGSGTGTYWSTQVSLNWLNFTLYYQLGKSNHWGSNEIGSGYSETVGSYKTQHFLGIRFKM